VKVIKEKIKVNDGIQKGTLIYNGTKHVADGAGNLIMQRQSIIWEP